MRIFNLAEELEKERKKNKELEEKLKLAKGQDLYGIKIVMNGEQYEAYKGALQDQINELQERIDKAIELLLDKYVRGLLNDNEVNNIAKILKGDNK